MAKVAAWVGGVMLLVGVGLGFVKSGECGSVFQPRDEYSDSVQQGLADAFGWDPPADCSQALDLTGPVWVLLLAGGALLLFGVAALAVANSNAKAKAVQDIAATEDTPPDKA